MLIFELFKLRSQSAAVENSRQQVGILLLCRLLLDGLLRSYVTQDEDLAYSFAEGVTCGP